MIIGKEQAGHQDGTVTSEDPIGKSHVKLTAKVHLFYGEICDEQTLFYRVHGHGKAEAEIVGRVGLSLHPKWGEPASTTSAIASSV